MSDRQIRGRAIGRQSIPLDRIEKAAIRKLICLGRERVIIAAAFGVGERSIQRIERELMQNPEPRDAYVLVSREKVEKARRRQDEARRQAPDMATNV